MQFAHNKQRKESVPCHCQY